MYDYNPYETTVSTAGILASFGMYLFVTSGIALFMLICMWKIYKKAGKKGWESIVPIYNIIVMLDIVGLPTWYIILMIIPFANIYVTIKMSLNLAKKFGKDTGFGILTIFFPYICYPILAFGKNTYEGTDGENYQTPNTQMNGNINQDVNPTIQNSNNVNPNVGVDPIIQNSNNVNPNVGVDPIIQNNANNNVNPTIVDNTAVETNATSQNISNSSINQAMTNNSNISANPTVVDNNISNTTDSDSNNVS